MESQYALRIIHKSSGEYVEWAPGLLIESNLVEELATRVSLKNVGVMKTRAQVVAQVREAMQEMLFDLKKQVR